MTLPEFDYGRIIRWTTTTLAIVLAVPVTLILVTWNSLPGDRLYATKRGLETVPRLVFGGNRTLAAQYETKITDRRFVEATTLVKKKNTDGFNDLRLSIRETAKKVKATKDPNIKKAYIAQLQNYQTALDKEKQVLIAAAITNPKPTPTTPPKTPTTPSTTPPVTKPSTEPPPTTTPPTPPPTTTPTTPTTPPVTPPPVVTPPPPPDPNDPIENIDETQDEIDDVIEDLEKQDLDDLDALENGVNEVEN